MQSLQGNAFHDLQGMCVANIAQSKVEEHQLPSSIQACKTREILNVEQAIAIYKIKMSYATAASCKNFGPCSVARAFGVSEKTVRDIWKGRTWLRETMHLDPTRVVMAAQLRGPGRPRLKSRFTEQNVARFSKSTNPQKTIGDLDTRKETKPTDFMFLPSAEETLATAVSQPSQIFAWWDQVPAKCRADREDSRNSLTNAMIDCFCCCEPWSAESAPLPESSCADDPFHDDWRYWPKLEKGDTFS